MILKKTLNWQLVEMEVELDLDKSVEENASEYFERSKKVKKKLQGLMQAIAETEEKLNRLQAVPVEKKQVAIKRKMQWFQAFHWFKSSDGFLVIGGRDAKSNEAIVKKHLDKEDVFLHADIQGASGCVIKSDGKKVPESTLQEAAQFSAVRSKAWQQGLPAVDVYAVAPGQVSKKAQSGEFLSTGAFMIYGERQWFRKTALQFAIGLLNEGETFSAMGGPPSAVKKHCIASLEIVQGKQKPSDVAKKLLGMFEKKVPQNAVSLDEIIAVLPGGSLGIRERF
ncbi:MAG: NFACT RNA binding domain-containing protein [Candidatus Diapherotrites archaeon]|nr:NFACT RNA binding domain-containing protein [Candidatus Diapherotrites archaeon]